MTAAFKVEDGTRSGEDRVEEILMTEKQRLYDRAKSKRRQAMIRAWVHNYKESRPCVDCGDYYPYYVMDFDHLGNKVAEVSRIMRRNNITNIKAEIEKCELVCSNCHRIRTQERLKILRISSAV